MIKNIGSPDRIARLVVGVLLLVLVLFSGMPLLQSGTLEGHFFHRGSGTHRNRSDEFLSTVSLAGSEYIQVLTSRPGRTPECLSVCD